MYRMASAAVTTDTGLNLSASYTYEDDLLTAYNGTAISYDEIGNPDGYGGRTFTWEHGRQMATQTRNGVTWTYTYDANGMRTKRSSDSKTYEYVYSGDKLVQMTVTDHTTSPETVQLMEFSYDAAGQPLTFTIDGVTYYYVLNIQGDVMGMVDGDGNLLYTMVYEGYGAGYYFSGGTAAATMLLGTNPLGYRGYVKDAGTGLYYLQSRYYDPALGRFINADSLVSTGQGLLGNNMFAYCLNNPACRKDISGTTSDDIFEDGGEVDLLDEDKSIAGGDQGDGIGGKSVSGKGGKSNLPKDGIKVSPDEALDMADEFLGPGYTEASPGRFVSADGLRQVRLGDADLLGLHGGAPHINFNILYPNYVNVHVFI